ncbi:MAG: hypothetical protein HQL53_09210 [Magnetococcales bacterium]|nr:hypothetical protein [Magnetococcales bacterium]
MTRRVPRYQATIKQTLIFYDAPQMLLLSGQDDNPIVALAVDHEDMADPFFACYVTKPHWQQYLSGKVDLRYLYDNPMFGNHYFFDLESVEEDKRVNLTKATPAQVKDEEAYWPGHGFFSYNHTEEIEGHQKVKTNEQRLFIDGTWDTTEFSDFMRSLSGIYDIHVLNDFIGISNKAAEQGWQRLKSAIAKRRWTAGGSYINFFSNLLGAAELNNQPMRLSGIQYASPGHLNFSCNKATYEAAIHTLQNYEMTEEEASKAFQHINKVLDREKLKTASPEAEFSSDDIRDHVQDSADVLLRATGIKRPDKIRQLCDDNILVYAKVSLAMFRRYKNAHAYISKGRVQLSQ